MALKRIVAILASSVMVISLLAGCGSTNNSTQESPKNAESTETAKTADSEEVTMGVLSILNVSEDEYAGMEQEMLKATNKLLSQSGVEKPEKPEDAPADLPEIDMDNPPKATFRYYDTLDAMVMALEAGEVKTIQLPQCTADYLAARNEKIFVLQKPEVEANEATEMVDRLRSNGFAFMMREDSIALRDEFDQVIDDMQADGTLDKLVQEYITDAIDDENQKAIELPTSGTETITVAVTGALPPMDYVAPDGTFAGFNTAILAEIGKRTGKNIVLKQVDSSGRSLALASGEVDVVFWTRVTLGPPDDVRRPSEEEIEARRKQNTSDDGTSMRDVIRESGIRKRGKIDMPEGTVVTDPYYSDSLVMAIPKK